MSKTVLFQTTQVNISTKFSTIRPIDWSRSGVTTLGQSGPGSDGNVGILNSPHSSSIFGTLPSDCLVSYPENSLGGVLALYREAVGVFYSLSQLVKILR